MNTLSENKICPSCGNTLFEDQDLAHDGYTGSPYAHNGRGSYGLARHHYYWVCDCGWTERPELSRNKALKRQRENRIASYNWNGIVLPKNAKSHAECIVLKCSSKQTKIERWIEKNAPSAHRGRGTRHSLLSSYRHTIVTNEFYEFAILRDKHGLIEDSYKEVIHDFRDEVYSDDNH